MECGTDGEWQQMVGGGGRRMVEEGNRWAPLGDQSAARWLAVAAEKETNRRRKKRRWGCPAGGLTLRNSTDWLTSGPSTCLMKWMQHKCISGAPYVHWSFIVKPLKGTVHPKNQKYLFFNLPFVLFIQPDFWGVWVLEIWAMEMSVSTGPLVPKAPKVTHNNPQTLL